MSIIINIYGFTTLKLVESRAKCIHTIVSIVKIHTVVVIHEFGIRKSKQGESKDQGLKYNKMQTKTFKALSITICYQLNHHSNQFCLHQHIPGLRYKQVRPSPTNRCIKSTQITILAVRPTELEDNEINICKQFPSHKSLQEKKKKHSFAQLLKSSMCKKKEHTHKYMQTNILSDDGLELRLWRAC